MRDNSEVVIGRIDPENLKSMLITAWNKICSARTIALNNSSQYYDIKSLEVDKIANKSAEQDEMKKKINNQVYAEAKKTSTETMYAEICKICLNSNKKMSEDDKLELDKLMSTRLDGFMCTGIKVNSDEHMQAISILEKIIERGR